MEALIKISCILDKQIKRYELLNPQKCNVSYKIYGPTQVGGHRCKGVWIEFGSTEDYYDAYQSK